MTKIGQCVIQQLGNARS